MIEIMNSYIERPPSSDRIPIATASVYLLTQRDTSKGLANVTYLSTLRIYNSARGEDLVSVCFRGFFLKYLEPSQMIPCRKGSLGIDERHSR